MKKLFAVLALAVSLLVGASPAKAQLIQHQLDASPYAPGNATPGEIFQGTPQSTGTPDDLSGLPDDASELMSLFDSAAKLPDSVKADRFNAILLADKLHLFYIVYASDEEYAPREKEELKALEEDLHAIDEAAFSSINRTYVDLVAKAATDAVALSEK